MYSAQLTKAFDFACEVHADQLRKGTAIPYISHLLGVASLVIAAGADEDTVIAALLHDAVEDCGGATMLDTIRKRFGDNVAEIVRRCSDSLSHDEVAWKARKRLYLAHLKEETNESVRIVALADKLHNARAILADYRCEGEALWSRFNGGREGTLWYYRQLCGIFSKSGHEPMASEFRQVVEDLERLTVERGAEIGRSPRWEGVDV